jgi:hypothetical protein
MAIASKKPLAEPSVQPNLPKVEPKSYKSIVTDDRYTPVNSLLAYISGSIWTVDYYGQVVTQHNDLREVDPGQPDIYQQYQKIKNVEIRVEGSLSTSYDEESSITTVRGTSLLYPFMTPNNNDYFIAEAGTKEKAIFRITQVNRKTFNTNSVFSIEYDLVGYISSSTELYNSLESKVVKSYHFSKDRLIEGLTPVVKTEEYVKIQDLSYRYKQLVAEYFQNFYNQRYGTIIVPGQSKVIYDSMLVNYLLSIVDSEDSHLIRSVRSIPTDKDIFLSQNHFWDVLYQRDRGMLKYCNSKMALLTKNYFNSNTFLYGVKYTNIDYLVYPVSVDTSVQLHSETLALPIADSVLDSTRRYIGSNPDIPVPVTIGNYTKNGVDIPLIKQVDPVDTYVLSTAFYAGTSDLSVIEILVRDYLENRAIDLDMLHVLLNDYRTWDRLEQYYYGPILMTLIKEAEKSQYT